MKSSGRRLKRVRPLLGTYVEIELRSHASVEELNAWITAGFDAVAEIDRLMSFHRPDSDLTRLNRSRPGSWIELHPHTIKVLQASNALFQASQGVFDIRCGAALVEQGSLPNHHLRYGHAVPSRDQVPVEFRGTRARKSGPWTLDLGGIAKGYAVDCAVNEIKKRASGHRVAGIVNAGGDLRTWGAREVPLASRGPGKILPWTRSFKLGPAAVATSSKQSYAHVDMLSRKSSPRPKTVTVLASDCLHADALTKVVLLGSSKLAARCLSTLNAQAFVLGTRGRLMEVLHE